MPTPTRTSRKAFAFEAGSEDHGKESSAYLTQGASVIGAGIGLRYSTPIGPLRADVGIPLDRRSGVDDIVQIYVSIGQAF